MAKAKTKKPAAKTAKGPARAAPTKTKAPAKTSKVSKTSKPAPAAKTSKASKAAPSKTSTAPAKVATPAPAAKTSKTAPAAKPTKAAKLAKSSKTAPAAKPTKTASVAKAGKAIAAKAGQAVAKVATTAAAKVATAGKAIAATAAKAGQAIAAKVGRAPIALDAAAQARVELLRAGALLPAGAGTDGLPADVVSARAFTHPALGDRVVVRLTSDPVARGEDLVHSFLGFREPTVTPSVAVRGRRALGFPAWALVHDPDNARHALDVLGEMRKATRKARGRPGQAKEAFDAIAKRLGRTVPRFLPSYHEEVGRVFADAGNRSWAGQYFNKAREAERVHALEVDVEARAAAFLEFALSGALTTKALTEYAQELSRDLDAASAHASFRELCVRRTLGGVAPWTGMLKDLRRLAKAAGLDVAAEDEALLADLLGAPALARAPADFWSEARAAVVAVSRRSPSGLAGLLELSPRPTGKSAGFAERWLALLEEAGAIQALADGAIEVEPASWLTRMIGMVNASYRHQWSTPDALLSIARRLAPRLVSRGVAVRVDQGAAPYWRPIDVDLCDLLLELRVPLEAPSPRASFQLEAWAKVPPGSTERPRDPVHVAADPRFAARLVKDMREGVCDDEFLAAARGKKGFVAAIRARLARRIEALDVVGLKGVADHLEALGNASREAYAEHRDLHERLSRFALGPALARSLRGGVIDELGWEALEAAVAELAPDGKGRLVRGGYFPYLCLGNERRAIVLGPAGRVLEHDLRLPKKASLERLYFAGGQLLVSYHTKTYDREAYWSGSPAKTFELDFGYGRDYCDAVELPDGGITTGGRALRPGDTELPKARGVYSDGVTCWRRDGAGTKGRLRELDPRTGDTGRPSWPRFLEEFLAPGWALDLGTDREDDGCKLAPLPAGLERTPLGAKDGLRGLRVRRADPPGGARAPEVEGIDGRRFTGRLGIDDDGRHDEDDAGPSDGLSVCGLLALPGEARPLPVTMAWSSITLWAPGGAFVAAELGDDDENAFARGTSLVPPLPFWHHLASRDEAGSRALRATTDAAARELLAAALAAKPAQDDAESAAAWLKAVEAEVPRRLPGVTHPRLARGVAGLALEAARLAGVHRELVARKDPALAPAAAGDASLTDHTVQEALAGLLDGGGYGDGEVGRELPQVAALLARPEPLERVAFVERGGTPWPDLCGRIGVAALRLVAPGTKDEERATLRRLLALWAATPFATHLAEHRVATLRFAKFPHKAPRGPDDDDDDDIDGTWVVEEAGVRTVLRPDTESRWRRRQVDEGTSVDAVQRSGARFVAPSGSTVTAERALAGAWGTAEQIERLLAEAERRGPLPWDPRLADEVARRTNLPRAEAALLVAGLPGLGRWESDFLGKELRERLGLRSTEAKLAKEQLGRVPRGKLLQVLARVPGDDAAALWERAPEDDDGLAARLSRAWVEVVGKRAAISEELRAAARRDIKGYPPNDAMSILELFASPEASPALTTDATWALGDGDVKEPEGEVLGLGDLQAVALGVPYLFLTLPVGDPMRAGIAAALRLVRERLKSPALLLPMGSVFVHESASGKDLSEDAAGKRKQAILDGVGGEALEWRPKPKAGGDDDDDDDDDRVKVGRDNGTVVAIADTWNVEMHLRPARLRGAADLAALRELQAAARGELLPALELLLSDEYTRLAARAETTPVAAGRFEADPRLSAPAVVTAAAAKLEVSEDAATLYLQTLALPAPTQKLVQALNGWTPSRYAKAGAELVGEGLLVEAKRERAGRALFLPGAWESLPAPATPLEAWKLAVLGVGRDAEGKVLRPFENGPVLPLRPIHEVFAAAWQRVEAGDAPGYEKLERPAKKRR